MAEYLAYIAMFSVILPLSVGLIFFKKTPTFFKLLLLPIGLSLFFDLLSFVPFRFNLPGFLISNYFDFCAIVVWGFVYNTLVKSHNTWNKVFKTFWVVCILLALTLNIDQTSNPENSSFSTNYVLANVYNIFQVISGLLTSFILLSKTDTWVKQSILQLSTVILCVIYFALLVAVYAFFDQLDPEETLQVFQIKWVAYIIFNLCIATIIYQSRNLINP